jgi:transglutaminase-like putative cysteine protease
MTAEQYRRLLGILMLWSIVPFPFLYIILPPFWILGAVVALILIARPSAHLNLPLWAMNVIGVGIIVAVAIAGGLRVGPLRPLGHLLLLLTTVRVLVVVDRKSFLRALSPVFLVWVVALTSSTHVTVALYFAVSAALWWWTGIRIHLTGLDGRDAAIDPSLPRIKHTAIAAGIALLLAIPIFLALPRLRSPWIAGRGGISSVTGFSSHVELAGVGTIRRSHEVAVIVRSASGEPLEYGWTRLRATALERVTLDSWAPRGASRYPEYRDGLIWPHGYGWRLEDTVELEVEVVHPRRYLFLPEDTVALDAPVPVRLDPSGGVVLTERPPAPLVYRVRVALSDPPRPTDAPRPDTREFPSHPDVRQLALDIVAGIETDEIRAAAVERHLQLNYSYSLNGMSHLRADPVSWFLLNQRQGHCEYFAGAMVALLTELDIPARMVAGYSGGDLSPRGVEAMVREANAHTWVEAWLGNGEGWTSFDPTPAASVPALDRPGGRERLRWALDWVQSSWDRYVLTFGFREQVGLITAVADALSRLRGTISRIHVITAVGLVAVAILLWWAGRRVAGFFRMTRSAARTPAAMAMSRVARRVEREGVIVPPSATVRIIANTARGLWPGAGSAVGELAWLAERELYAARTDQTEDHAMIRSLWLRARQAMRQTP